MSISNENWLSQSDQHHIITPQHPDYPSRLQTIAKPPKQLFVRGNPQRLSDPQIAIVGSRNMTYYGKDNANQFAKDLAKKGLTITSGLAMGIDAAAHQGALTGQGYTIAVLGSGIDNIYPAQHQALAEQILAQGGAIVSEYPPGTEAEKYNFPMRNRIVTGLSLGLLVVEAQIQSGSLISARLAMEQNREVFTIPGSIHSPMSKGCHQLLKQGVKCVESSQDILEELQGVLHGYILADSHDKTPQNVEKVTALTQDQVSLLAHIDYEPTPVDLIVKRSHLPTQEVCSMLLMLEMADKLKKVNGGYVKI